MAVIVKADITDCPRCGNDHQNVTFRRFRKNPEKYTHWTLCYDTGDPILVEIDNGTVFNML